MHNIVDVEIYRLQDKDSIRNYAFSTDDKEACALIKEVFEKSGIKEKDPNMELKFNSRFHIWAVVHTIDEFLCGQRNKQHFMQCEDTVIDDKGKTKVITSCIPIYPFAQHLLAKNEDKSDQTRKKEFFPIVHLVPTSIFVDSLYGTTPLVTLIPRLYQIMDSSIWNYLIPIVPFTYPDYIIKDGVTKGSDYEIDPMGIKRGKSKLDVLIKNAIDNISDNYDNNLYSLEISQEYADLNARLVGESFLSGGHASGVAPFIFHSERAIERLIEKEFRTQHIDSNGGLSTIKRIEKHNWRILLVDDKSNDYLKPLSCKVTKLQIIKRLIKEQFQGLTIETRSYNDQNVIPKDKETLLIESAETIQEAEMALSKRKYDLILLDYLLEKDERQYGYELLENIYKYTEAKKIFESISPNMILDALRGKYTSAKFEEFLYYISNNKEVKRNIDYILEQIELLDKEIDNEKKEKRKREKEQERETYIKKVYEIISDQFKSDKYLVGPHNRFFFIFISAYSSAVYERLLAEGLNRSEKYWHIAVGACPTNTPKLFLYNLLKLMEKQLEDSGVDKLSAKGIFDVVNNIYGKKDEVRRMANEKYQDVLDLHYLYRKMLKDVEIPKDSIFNTKGSVLITNFIKENVNLGGLLEHLTQLVHLTAFGTVRQWPEMWEEYIYFKSQFDLEQFKKQYDEKDFYTLCEDIESYILNLKSDIG